MSSGQSQRRAVVVGGGVSGLTTAVTLQRRGYDVTVWTKDPLEHTTSHVAAALWYPYRAGPEQRVTRWCLRSFPEFERIAQDPQSGVCLVEAIERLEDSDEPMGPPAWASILPSCEIADHEMRFTTAVIETPIYLPWLAGQFAERGGCIETRTAATLAEAFDSAPVVINAAGLGSRELAQDDTVFPVRGQLLVVDRHGDDVKLHHRTGGDFTYVVPRASETLLGGTAQEHATSLEADDGEREEVLRRALALGVSPKAVRAVRVGLRPCRPTVRLELETRADGLLGHNYGHGGAGVTLSWGCALDLTDLVEAAHSKTMK